MKKIFAALIVALMAVSVTACNNNDSNNTVSQVSTVVVEESKLATITKTDDTQDDYLTDTKLYKCFYEKLQSDNVYINVNGKMETSGISMDISMEIQKQGEKTYVSMSMFGMDIKAISKDGYNYTLNDSTKQYAKTAVEESGESSDISDSFSNIAGSLENMKFIENALSTEDGVTDYEVYSSDGSTLTVYFNGNEIKYIETVTGSETSDESGEETEPTRINVSVTNETDESLFEIPSDYEEVDGSELYDLSGLLGGSEITEE